MSLAYRRRGDEGTSLSTRRGLNRDLELGPQEKAGGCVEATRNGGLGRGSGRHRRALLIDDSRRG
jgi:hypothetical protein